MTEPTTAKLIADAHALFASSDIDKPERDRLLAMAATETKAWVETARKVVAEGQYQHVNHETGALDPEGVILDLFTASMLTQVYDALKPASQAKFGAMPLWQALDTGWKLVAKTSEHSNKN